jgi:hypothetical protein
MNEKKPSNPSAFPFVDRSETQNTLMAFSDGMTLRDYFANSAMKQIITYHYATDNYLETISKQAYQIADAMLKQREL